MKISNAFWMMVFFLLSSHFVNAQKQMTYQTPSKAIVDLVDAKLPPFLRLSPAQDVMLLLERPTYPAIAELAQEELRLAGLRINPTTNGASRSSFFIGLRLKTIEGNKEQTIKGLPENARIENISWSPDGSKIAFSNTVDNGLELWIVDVKSAAARKLNTPMLNDALRGAPYEWFSDNQSILYKTIPAERGERPKRTKAPSGPVIQFNDGKEAPARTYQDLLKNR